MSGDAFVTIVRGVGAKSATERVREPVDEPTELAAAGPASAYDDAAAVDRQRGHGRRLVIELVRHPRPPPLQLHSFICLTFSLSNVKKSIIREYCIFCAMLRARWF